MKYETGMQIIYDVLKKGVFVEFRRRSHYLPGPFPDQKTAIAAAEDRCREMGWRPEDVMPPADAIEPGQHPNIVPKLGDMLSGGAW